VENVMKHGLILARLVSLGVSAPALAGAPIALHSEVVQAQIPAYPPTSPALVAPAFSVPILIGCASILSQSERNIAGEFVSDL
jgi:hypothetical protein